MAKSGEGALADAIMASGLVRATKVPDPQPGKGSGSGDERSLAERKAATRRAHQLFEQSQTRAQSQLKSSVEDIIVDRVTNPPLPRLRPESTMREYSDNVSDISFLRDPPKRKHEATHDEILASFSPGEQITFPRVVLGAQTIGKTQIASRANYEQLNNLLHTLTAEIEGDLDASKEDKLCQQKEAFDTVMSEMVKQSFFESSAKGELLQEMRMFMSDAVDQIPVLQRKMARQDGAAQQKITALASENEDLGVKNQKLTETNQRLERFQNESKSKMDFLESRVASTEDENRTLRMGRLSAESQMKKQEEDLARVRAEKDQLKAEMERKIEMADSVSAELQQIVDTYGKQGSRETELSLEITQLKGLMSAVQAECDRLKEQLAAKAEEPVKKNVEIADKETQTRTAAKPSNARLRPKVVQPEVPAKPVMNLEEIQTLKDDYSVCQDVLNKKGISLDEFTQIRNAVLQQHGHFVPLADNVLAAQDGTFSLEKTSYDECKLLAHTIMSRVMERAVRSVARSSVETQTISPISVAKVNVQTMVMSGELASPEFGDAFTKLLDPAYANRPPRTFEWMMKSLRSIFDEKTLKDAVDVKEGRTISAMPQFTLQWSTRQYGLSYLAHQCCWDLVNSARAHQGKNIEIEMFRKFLDEEYSMQQLTFFLRVRSHCMRRGITVSMKLSTDETYTEVYVPGPQGLDIIRQIFEKGGQEFVDSGVRQLRERFVRRPAATLDPNTMYVSMVSVLGQAVDSFDKYEVMELRKMMHICHLKKQLDGDAFRALLKELIPSLSENDIADFSRIMNSSRETKKLVSRGRFKEQFIGRSLLNKGAVNVLSADEFGEPSPELEVARGRWRALQPTFDEALEREDGPEKNQSLAYAKQCLRVEMDRVAASITCCDVVGVHKHMLSCIMSYQTLKWTVAEPDAGTMDGVTNQIRNLLNI